jgi:hypothetical protein
MIVCMIPTITHSLTLNMIVCMIPTITVFFRISSKKKSNINQYLNLVGR